MKRRDAYDPEIEADRLRRERAPIPPSIDELAHPDPALLALYDRKPEPITAHWPCRFCGAPVAMTPSAIATAKEHAATFNRQLRVRREPPIVAERAMICSTCRVTPFDQQPQPKAAT